MAISEWWDEKARWTSVMGLLQFKFSLQQERDTLQWRIRYARSDVPSSPVTLCEGKAACQPHMVPFGIILV